MPAIVRAARSPALSPGGTASALPPDVDTFTATAELLERLLDPGERLQGPVDLHWIGPPMPVAEYGLPVLLGLPTTVTFHEGDRAGWAAALAALRAEARGERLLLATHPAEGGAPGESPLDIVAAVIQEGEGLELLAPDAPAEPTGGSPGDRDSPFDRLVEGLQSAAAGSAEVDLGSLGRLRRTGPLLWQGPLPRTSGAPPPPGAAGPAGAPRLEAVSEGAYVPWASYLENLPSRWRFAASRCSRCRTLRFPLRRRCPACASSEPGEPLDLPRRGLSVLAVTTIATGAQPTEFDAQVAVAGAYDVVLAELAPSVRVTLQVTGTAPGAIRPGDRVDTVLRRLYPMEGRWRYGRKAVPAAG